MSDKRLYKSSENSMLCGVCGGIAEYFDIDPTLVRLAWVILTCFGGAGIWAYIIAAIIIPKRSQNFKIQSVIRKDSIKIKKTAHTPKKRSVGCFE